MKIMKIIIVISQQFDYYWQYLFYLKALMTIKSSLWYRDSCTVMHHQTYINIERHFFLNHVMDNKISLNRNHSWMQIKDKLLQIQKVVVADIKEAMFYVNLPQPGVLLMHWCKFSMISKQHGLIHPNGIQHVIGCLIPSYRFRYERPMETLVTFPCNRRVIT